MDASQPSSLKTTSETEREEFLLDLLLHEAQQAVPSDGVERHLGGDL